MEGSGGESEGNVDHVLDLGARHVEVGRDLGEAVAGLEAVDQILNQVLVDWLRVAAPNCKWTASVCTGAGLYAAAGLLDGKTTTTHWGFRDNPRPMGIEVVADRVVWQDNHVSGAGVSAGIDMALSLTDRVHGRELAESLQLVIEYDPQPPFNSGSPTKADASTLRLAFRLLLGDRPVELATQMYGQAIGARLRRARVALSDRRRETHSARQAIH
jgi:transcriptional regulator GlxA family with amidase domain